ncbi:ATP-binding protein [Streptomyces aidingensis]|uniref:Anti-sigma regulatory factor (Ser/Thr protein kinase) n=1 Tax=Streptomyces aidingensis TaxID=910347 RepID=A0A1I1VED0_9ACTN|nr:ATP-binding protein [Streptomyces aidingensis]SFD79453.1 Anti-sigma regulatory factor (Ser/Thr protein kinase) [Streptomyces aidingensis]
MYHELTLTTARTDGGGIRRHGCALPAEPPAAGMARRLTREKLCRWGLECHADLAELLVSELVTNAVRYGGGPVELLLEERSGRLRCAVGDRRAELPHLAPCDQDSEGGRGLHLVDTLADDWGVDRDASGGKTVWFELTPPPLPLPA